MSDIHDELHVFLNTDRIGTLSQDNGAMSFAYSTEYLRSPDAYPLSQNLPLTDEVFHDPAVENFFSNLLPDELKKRYSPAVASRLLGEFKQLRFFGDDIRMLKSRMQNR